MVAGIHAFISQHLTHKIAEGIGADPIDKGTVARQFATILLPLAGAPPDTSDSGHCHRYQIHHGIAQYPDSICHNSPHE